MGLLNKISSLFSSKGGGEGDAHAYFFYVRCKACGEKIRVRADRRWDLAQEFDDNDRVSGYTMTKDVMGTKCFRMMHLRVEFDGGYRIKSQSIEGGALITKQEFAQE